MAMAGLVLQFFSLLAIIAGTTTGQQRSCRDSTALRRSCGNPRGSAVPSRCDSDACARAFEGWWKLCSTSVPRGPLHDKLRAFHSKCEAHVSGSTKPPSTGGSWPDTYVLADSTTLHDKNHRQLTGTYKRLPGKVCNGAPVYKGTGTIDETYLYRHAKNPVGGGLYWAIGEGSGAEWNSFDCRINGVAFETTKAPKACTKSPSDPACAGKWQECKSALCQPNTDWGYREFHLSDSVKVLSGAGGDGGGGH